MKRFIVLALAVAVPGILACNGDSTDPIQPETFAATLTGAAEVPPVTTDATGTATVVFNPATGSYAYVLTVSSITGVTAAHIHGPATAAENAGVLVPLTTPTLPEVAGSFTAADITAAGVSGDSLLALLRAGRTYVNVHTTANPPGEIRGQLMPQ
jgi:hypothetical protein